jgi:hypothetical protein
MLRWWDLPELALRWIGRLYGSLILGVGIVLLYFAARGLVGYARGIRAAWTDPIAGAAGFVAGVLALWIGARLLRRGIPFVVLGSGRRSRELASTLEEVDKLQREDPVAADQLLENYFTREAATKEVLRAELRAQSSHDVEAARALRRELQAELELNAVFRKDVLKKWPEDQRQSMLAEIDETTRQYRSELLELDETIERLRLR